MASPLDRPDVATVLGSTPYADVAVDTARGPHITPAAFAAAGGRLWVVSSRRTLRVRSVRRRHHASVLVRHGSRSVVISGSADVLSFWRPSETVGIVMNSGHVARAAATYALRNSRLLLGGFLRDILAGTGDLTVYDRVLVAIEPERGMLLDGDRLLHTWGRWRRVRTPEVPRPHAHVPPLDDLVAGLPPAVLDALEHPRSASLGWSSPTGAVALPALEATADGQVQVPLAAFDVTGGARSAAARRAPPSPSPPSGPAGGPASAPAPRPPQRDATPTPPSARPPAAAPGRRGAARPPRARWHGPAPRRRERSACRRGRRW